MNIVLEFSVSTPSGKMIGTSVSAKGMPVTPQYAQQKQLITEFKIFICLKHHKLVCNQNALRHTLPKLLIGGYLLQIRCISSASQKTNRISDTIFLSKVFSTLNLLTVLFNKKFAQYLSLKILS